MHGGCPACVYFCVYTYRIGWLHVHQPSNSLVSSQQQSELPPQGQCGKFLSYPTSEEETHWRNYVHYAYSLLSTCVHLIRESKIHLHTLQGYWHMCESSCKCARQWRSKIIEDLWQIWAPSIYSQCPCIENTFYNSALVQGRSNQAQTPFSLQRSLCILTSHVSSESAPPESKLPTHPLLFVVTTKNPRNVSLAMPERVTAWAERLMIIVWTAQVMTCTCHGSLYIWLHLLYTHTVVSWPSLISGLRKNSYAFTHHSDFLWWGSFISFCTELQLRWAKANPYTWDYVACVHQVGSG